MYYEPPSEERKEEMIKRIARSLVDKGLDSVASLFLNNYKSLTFLGSQFSIGILSPFLMLFGDREKTGYQLMRLFENESNVEELIQKIEEFKKEKKIKESEKREPPEPRKRDIRSYLTQIWNSLF